MRRHRSRARRQLSPGRVQERKPAANFIKARIAKGTKLNADEAAAWDGLHKNFEMARINHEEAYSLDGACTNWAEYFSRLRRAEIGHHHHVAGAYLLRYAQEVSWREDNRRVSNGDQVNRIVALAMSAQAERGFHRLLAAARQMRKLKMKLVETIISETTVKMRYANHEDASEAKHWIDFQVPLHELKQVSDTALGDPEPHFLSDSPTSSPSLCAKSDTTTKSRA